MSNSSPSAELPDTLTRSGPSFEALFEVNQQLQAHAASPTAFERRFEDPPPSYHSSSPSPSLTPNGEPFDAADDDPAFLQKPAEDAKAIPRLQKRNKHRKWSKEQFQRDFDAWLKLDKIKEQEKAEMKERHFRLLTSGPCYGLFGYNGPKSDHEPANHSQMEKVLAGQRKRKRIEVGLLCNQVQGSVDPSPKPLKHVRRKAPRQDKFKLSNETLERQKGKERKEPPTTLRRSERIAKMTEPVPLNPQPKQAPKRTRSTRFVRNKSKH